MTRLGRNGISSLVPSGVHLRDAPDVLLCDQEAIAGSKGPLKQDADRVGEPIGGDTGFIQSIQCDVFERGPIVFQLATCVERSGHGTPVGDACLNLTAPVDRRPSQESEETARVPLALDYCAEDRHRIGGDIVGSSRPFGDGAHMFSPLDDLTEQRVA